MATIEDTLAMLEHVGATMRAQFPENQDRLEQLASLLAGASMAVEHLYDEQEREQELIARVLATPRGLSPDDPRNLVTRHGHQLPAGVLENV